MGFAAARPPGEVEEVEAPHRILHPPIQGSKVDEPHATSEPETPPRGGARGWLGREGAAAARHGSRDRLECDV